MSQCTFSACNKRYSPSKIRNLFCSDATSNPELSVLIIDANQTCAVLTKHLLANVGMRQQFVHIIWFRRSGFAAAQPLE